MTISYREHAVGRVAWLVLISCGLVSAAAKSAEVTTLTPALSQREREGAGEERTWTDVDGRTMRAVFLREVDGDATFLQGGKLVTMPLERLSEADRQVIRQIEGARVKPEPIPETKAPETKAPEAKAAEASPFVERGNSAVFEEMRVREEKRRLEQGEGAAAERRQGTGDRGQETGDRGQETGDSGQESGVREQKAIGGVASVVASEPAREALRPAAASRFTDVGAKQKTLWVAVIILVGVLGTVAILVGLVGAMGAR